MYGGFPKLGVPYWGGSYNQDYSIFGSTLGFPYLGKLPYWVYWNLWEYVQDCAG